MKKIIAFVVVVSLVCLSGCENFMKVDVKSPPPGSKLCSADYQCGNGYCGFAGIDQPATCRGDWGSARSIENEVQ